MGRPERIRYIRDLLGRLMNAALHLANDDIENCHLIAQAHEGVSIA